MTNGEKFKDVFGFGADGSRVIAVNSTWWDCDFQIEKPKTNADRIRSMTDEELAEWFVKVQDDIADYYDKGHSIAPEMPTFKESWLDWLKQEAQDG